MMGVMSKITLMDQTDYRYEMGAELGKYISKPIGSLRDFPSSFQEHIDAKLIHEGVGMVGSESIGENEELSKNSHKGRLDGGVSEQGPSCPKIPEYPNLMFRRKREPCNFSPGLNDGEVEWDIVIKK